MEMNTRLQVEHPITELITGIDLVEWQLRVAAGQPLPLSQAQIPVMGHAFEARLYAENPENEFLPSTGKLQQLLFPKHKGFDQSEVRIDSGVREGDTISPYYDPMIAKLIAHGPDRQTALTTLINALNHTHIRGPHTNVRFLQRLAADTAFAQADLDTGFIQRRTEALFPDPPKMTPEALAVAGVARMAVQGFGSNHRSPSLVADPWDSTDGWRLNAWWTQALQFSVGAQSYPVLLRQQDGRWRYEGRPLQWQSRPAPHGHYLHLQLAHHLINVRVYIDGHHYNFELFGKHYELQFDDPIQQQYGHSTASDGDLKAPMPGKVISVAVAAGDVVKTGQIVLVLEAMKMEHAIQSPHDGVVSKVFYDVGDQVNEGADLLVMEQTTK